MIRTYYKLKVKMYRRLSSLCYDLGFPILSWRFIGRAWDIELEHLPAKYLNNPEGMDR